MRAHLVISRVLALAMGALVCALLSGLAALYTLGLSLPPSNAAYGLSVREMLADPFVRVVWLPLTLGSGALGFAVSLWALWKVKLHHALPIVTAASVGAAALAGPAAFMAPIFSLSAALLAMLGCRAAALPARSEGVPTGSR